MLGKDKKMTTREARLLAELDQVKKENLELRKIIHQLYERYGVKDDTTTRSTKDQTKEVPGTVGKGTDSQNDR